METLKFLLQSKKADSALPSEVVGEAVNWMHTQFRNAGVVYYYSDGGGAYGRYGYFQIKSLLKEQAITLHVKITEIKSCAYVFAEVRVRGQSESILFPYFAEMDTEEGRLTLLHFIADFLLSTAPDLTTM